MDIYLLRHGQTTQPDTFTGVTDIGLSTTGEKQIHAITPELKKVNFDHCFCSPLTRCRETLRLLGLACSVTIDETIKEIDFGSWEGLSYKQIQELYPAELKRWSVQKEAFTFPGGARIDQFNLRIQQWFDELVNTGHNRVLVVAHGGVLRTGLCALLELGSDNMFRFNFTEGAVSKIGIREGYSYLEYFNCRG